MKYTHTIVLALASDAFAAPRTSAPSGCSTVSASGGDFTTVQDAVNAATAGGCIFLDQGVYAEQVLVNNTQGLTIYGYTSDDASYSGNGATIVANASQDLGINNDQTGTLRVHASDFKLYNVNVQNSRGEGSQAIALSAYNSSGYYGCSFNGYQDTVLTNELQQLYVNCEIAGVTDFIFGQRSFAWFEGCDLRVLEASLGYVTANGAESEGSSKYVFNNCDIAAKEGDTVTSGAFYLGRPWRSYANVVFQNTSMSNVINSAGWSEWSVAEPRTANLTFAEYANFGDGAVGPRADFYTNLSAPIAISDILGIDYTTAGYYDASYL